MHAASRLFSWSMELLAFASRLFAPKMLDHLPTTYVCHFNIFLLANERSGRNRPLSEAACTHIQTNRHTDELSNGTLFAPRYGQALLSYIDAKNGLITGREVNEARRPHTLRQAVCVYRKNGGKKTKSRRTQNATKSTAAH